MLAWAQNRPWSQAWSPLPKPTHSAQGCACLCSPRSQPTALTPHPAGYEETLTRLAAILAKHFADTRIVGTGEVPYRRLGGMGWDGMASLAGYLLHKMLARWAGGTGARAHARYLLRPGLSQQTSVTR